MRVFRRLAALSAALWFLGFAARRTPRLSNANREDRLSPFRPAGPTDFVARVSPTSSKAFWAERIIENKPGANAAIGADSVAKSDPDGYTLFFNPTAGAVVINPPHAHEPALRPGQGSSAYHPGGEHHGGAGGEIRTAM
jgi:tripartite-type tricarboxylate transporter receptor subunit TctC